ncbi:methionyl-tRNA formyltransferase [Flavobacteriaceae bacterium]|nr:methionyl-tRNA formyltransferase [Flavobacteriaceae bacterium]
MSVKALNIIFMGTPDFAVDCLDNLIKSKHKVLGVVTAEDKKAGRGKKIKISDVKEYCLKNNIKIFQPEKLKNIDFINTMKSFDPDLFIVVAFRMLPEVLWKIPKLGTINLHASLLPNLRGAAPIHWAIINGLKETGLTTFFINEKIDCGNIIEQSKVQIDRNQNTGDLYNILKKIGSKLILSSLDLIQDKTFKSIHQDVSNNDLSAPKLDKINTKINWNDSSENIHNLIRGLSPFPAAWTSIKENKKILKIYKSKNNYTNTIKDYQPGIIIFNDNSILASTKDGFIEILELQIQGKRKMTSFEFINGYKTLDKQQLN